MVPSYPDFIAIPVHWSFYTRQPFYRIHARMNIVFKWSAGDYQCLHSTTSLLHSLFEEQGTLDSVDIGIHDFGVKVEVKVERDKDRKLSSENVTPWHSELFLQGADEGGLNSDGTGCADAQFRLRIEHIWRLDVVLHARMPRFSRKREGGGGVASS